MVSNPGAEALRAQLLDGLPARVKGMAEALILEWEAAVNAVPHLAHAASSELITLLRMDPVEREATIRHRWQRWSEVEVDLRGRSQRSVAAGNGSTDAQRGARPTRPGAAGWASAPADRAGGQ
jgi:hypothetical protein